MNWHERMLSLRTHGVMLLDIIILFVLEFRLLQAAIFELGFDRMFAWRW